LRTVEDVHPVVSQSTLDDSHHSDNKEVSENDDLEGDVEMNLIGVAISSQTSKGASDGIGDAEEENPVVGECEEEDDNREQGEAEGNDQLSASHPPPPHLAPSPLSLSSEPASPISISIHSVTVVDHTHSPLPSPTSKATRVASAETVASQPVVVEEVTIESLLPPPVFNRKPASCCVVL